MDNRKELFNSIIIAMLVVISVVMSALIIGSLLDNSIFNNIAITGTNSDETLISVSNVTNSTFAIISTHPTAICNLQSIVNATGGEAVIGTGNYTYYTNCRLIMQDDSPYIGEDLNVTYTYSYNSGINLAGINVTEVQEQFGLFVTGLIAFLAIIGTIVGIVWLVYYVKKLFDKETGLQGISA